MSAATDRQTDFIKTLFSEAQTGLQGADASVVVQVTPLVESVQPTLVAVVAGQVPDRKDASDAIQALKDVNAIIRDAKAKADAPAQLKGADRVIPNRFATKCCTCQEDLAEGAGYAAIRNGKWFNWCNECANETDEQVAIRRIAEHEAAQARNQAIQVENDAKIAARRAAQSRSQENWDKLDALLGDLLVRANQEGKKGITVGAAIDSATGNNDLDFFAIHVNLGGRRSIRRVIGGHNDQGLAIDQATAAAERLVALEDFKAAMVTYGREIGSCGKCGRHLTDEVSRARGLGPTCAKGI